jgi:hypothetical protein
VRQGGGPRRDMVAARQRHELHLRIACGGALGQIMIWLISVANVDQHWHAQIGQTPRKIRSIGERGHTRRKSFHVTRKEAGTLGRSQSPATALQTLYNADRSPLRSLAAQATYASGVFVA